MKVQSRATGVRSLRVLGLLFLVVNTVRGLAAEIEDRWWPVQKMPQVLLRTTAPHEFPAPGDSLQVMMQSVAGLAAKAMNEGRGEEMVWVTTGGDLERWHARLLATHAGLEKEEAMGPWELVERFTKRGLIKGYILYRRDRSKGDTNAYRAGMDCSINVATSLAGILDGVIVDEELEEGVKAHGLKLLMDVRDKTQKWCFATYKEQFNRRMLCTQDPRKLHVRDLAIAQKALTIYGKDEPTPAAMEWLEPLSPILGWNGGDEFETTDLSTSYGHIQTSTDWSMNLPVLMAGTERLDPPKAKSLDPRAIDWNDTRSAVSFIGSDGDNVQWVQGNFFHDGNYWGNPERGKIPYGWSFCFAHLAQLCPQAIEHALSTRTPNDCLIEWGGGYYFPERFGLKRKNGPELLAAHARRTWHLMKKTNARIIGFNFGKFDSPEARQACEVFAGQTDGLLAILAFEYSAYEGGAGRMFWVKDRHGIELPVISARYAIWEHLNNREHAGTPAKVAREIRQTVEKTPADQLPRYDWAIAHVWSWFKHVPGTDENAENMPQETAAAAGGVRGYSPVTWCAERLPASVRVVSPEELVWRIRMKHNPAQTRELMKQYP